MFKFICFVIFNGKTARNNIFYHLKFTLIFSILIYFNIILNFTINKKDQLINTFFFLE